MHGGGAARILYSKVLVYTVLTSSCRCIGRVGLGLEIEASFFNVNIDGF